MERFLARCPHCTAETLLDTGNLRLLAPADTGRSVRVVFTCPDCRERTSIPVGPDIATALQACGVPVSHGHPSLGPPPRHPAGPPIGYDDLLDFHLLLERPGWFEALAAEVGRAGRVRTSAAGSV